MHNHSAQTHACSIAKANYISTPFSIMLRFNNKENVRKYIVTFIKYIIYVCVVLMKWYFSCMQMNVYREKRTRGEKTAPHTMAFLHVFYWRKRRHQMLGRLISKDILLFSRRNSTKSKHLLYSSQAKLF